VEVVGESVKRDLSSLSHKQLAAIFKQTSPEFDGIVLDFKVPYVESRIIQVVLRIRDVYPGSEFFHPGSRIKKIPVSGSGSASKNLSIFNPKKHF
jgi:hypothetical protein